jgi:hypothetical protein
VTERVYDDIELMTEESMMPKVVSQLLESLLWRRRGR